MKNFLAIDTSGDYLSVVLSFHDMKYTKYLPDCTMSHSVELMSVVDGLLKEAGAKLSDFDFFACVVGAGSFTGIRIGISTVKGFCYALKKPALPITSFELGAYTDLGKRTGKNLILVDALHGHYYARATDGERETLPPSYIDGEKISSLEKEGYFLRSARPLAFQTQTFDPSEGLYFAVSNLAKDEKNFGELKGLYVRKSQAEIEREEKKND